MVTKKFLKTKFDCSMLILSQKYKFHNRTDAMYFICVTIDKTKLAIKIVIANGGGLLQPLLYVAIFQNMLLNVLQ